MTKMPIENARYRVSGMDCGKCVAKIERAARAVPGVTELSVSLTFGEMKIAGRAVPFAELERKVTELGYGLSRLDAPGGEPMPQEAPGPGYRRALWVVILLNLVYGLAEAIGGLIAGSQALKADALDFLGDGAITLLGLVAIGWSARHRAQAALLQGIFLGLLGLGVLLNTVYRVLVVQLPSIEIMGVMGALALVVNVVAAGALLPYRVGDANMRAVWLFSRNDAIGNLAVVIAAAVVAWTDAPWPDLFVAAVIAGLFLHSAAYIVTDARKELRC